MVNVCVASNCTISSFAIPTICVAVAALPVVEPDDPLTFPVTSPVRFPVKAPAITPVPVIVGDVNVLLVNVCVASNCTISAFAIPTICVAVAALPVTSPVNIASVPSVPLSNILLKPSLA